MIIEPYKIDTELELDVLRELCLEHTNCQYIYQALKSKDKFSQTPMLSSISASENINEIWTFLLNLILKEKNTDVNLQEVAILNCNKHNESILSSVNIIQREDHNQRDCIK